MSFLTFDHGTYRATRWPGGVYHVERLVDGVFAPYGIVWAEGDRIKTARVDGVAAGRMDILYHPPRTSSIEPGYRRQSQPSQGTQP